MSFQQALSGLNSSDTSLAAIGNNIANASTVGYKGANAQFADMFALAMMGNGSSIVGIGSSVADVRQQFTQGNMTTTNNPLDIAVNGAGLFRLTNSDNAITYTRNGQFLLDKDGFIVSNHGLKLTGYAADPLTGTIVPGNIATLQINNKAIPPQVTSNSQIMVNLDSRAKPPTTLTSGNITGDGPVFAGLTPLTITAGTNDTLDVTVDGVNGTSGVSVTGVTIAPGTYSSSVALAAEVQSKLNAALAAVDPTVQVKVTIDASNQMVITSNSVGTRGTQGNGSMVSVDGGSAQTDLFGAAPVATSGTDVFDVTSTDSYTAATAQTVFDTLGNPHTMSLYFVKTSQPGYWQMYTSLDGSVLMDPADPTAVPPVLAKPNCVELRFSTTGGLIVPAPGTKIQRNFDITTGATTPLTYDLDLAGTTQYGISFGTNQLIQDGYTSGKLAGLSVSNDGVVQGRYSNGQTSNMGQVVLANFNNLNGLVSLGNNLFAETSASGQPIPGAPGTGNLGTVQSGSVEESNVDLTKELVNMITAQRNYQANAQTIKTQDQIMQTIVNLR